MIPLLPCVSRELSKIINFSSWKRILNIFLPKQMKIYLTALEKSNYYTVTDKVKMMNSYFEKLNSLTS